MKRTTIPIYKLEKMCGKRRIEVRLEFPLNPIIIFRNIVAALSFLFFQWKSINLLPSDIKSSLGNNRKERHIITDLILYFDFAQCNQIIIYHFMAPHYHLHRSIHMITTITNGVPTEKSTPLVLIFLPRFHEIILLILPAI